MREEAILQVRTVCDETGNRLICSGALDATLASDLHRCALDLLASGRDVTVDFAELESIDVCSLQILLALRCDLAALDRKLNVSNTGANGSRLLKLAGLARVLQI